MNLTPTLRPVLLAVAWLGIFVLATPGLDLQTHREEYTRGEIWQIQDEHGVWGSTVAGAALAVNQAVREPLVSVFQVFLRPFRGGQSWALFTRGRASRRWFEVHIDDALVYRSASARHTWRRAAFRNRHVRPLVQMFVTKDENLYADAFVRWVGTLAREDFPTAQRVTLLGLESPFGQGKRREIRRVSLTAPRWSR